MAAPRALTTGIGSPVSADSSMVAAVELMTPSTGMTSPARTRSRSPTATADIGTSSMRSSARRWASRGARSTSERRSCSARATAISSSTLPPEYISATTAPASGWPSASAALIDTSAIASTPSRPARKSRTIETASPATTGAVASHPSRDRRDPFGRRHRRRSRPPVRQPRSRRVPTAGRAQMTSPIPCSCAIARAFRRKRVSLRLSEIKREATDCSDVQAGMKCNQAVLPASMVSTLPATLRPPSPNRYSPPFNPDVRRSTSTPRERQ